MDSIFAFCVQIYLTAGKMFNLEDRVKDLHTRVDGGGSNSSAHNLTYLEDEVAKTAAQVARSEKEVRLCSCLKIISCCSREHRFGPNNLFLLFKVGQMKPRPRMAKGGVGGGVYLITRQSFRPLIIMIICRFVLVVVVYPTIYISLYLSIYIVF